jgi:hypothetical protein
MRPGKDLTGRNWPGSLCRFCTHFVPDVLSETYTISCRDCGGTIGSRAFDRHWSDLDEGDVQVVLKAESDRAARAKLELDRLNARLDVEKDPRLLGTLRDELLRRRAAGLHVPRDFKLRPSWQKRHEELRGNHFCADCHAKRRAAGTDFDEAPSYATYEVKCSVCKKTVAHLYVGEHHGPEIHESERARSAMDCTGTCADYAAKVAAEIRRTVSENKTEG